MINVTWFKCNIYTRVYVYTGKRAAFFLFIFEGNVDVEHTARFSVYTVGLFFV